MCNGYGLNRKITELLFFVVCKKGKARVWAKEESFCIMGFGFCNEWDHACRFEELVKQISVDLKFENYMRFRLIFLLLNKWLFLIKSEIKGFD